MIGREEGRKRKGKGGSEGSTEEGNEMKREENGRETVERGG